MLVFWLKFLYNYNISWRGAHYTLDFYNFNRAKFFFNTIFFGGCSWDEVFAWFLVVILKYLSLKLALFYLDKFITYWLGPKWLKSILLYTANIFYYEKINTFKIIELLLLSIIIFLIFFNILLLIL